MNRIRIPQQSLKIGAVLERTAFAGTGELLARAGTELTPRLVEMLFADGWYEVKEIPEGLFTLESSWNRKERLPGVRPNARSRFFASAERHLMALDQCFVSMLGGRPEGIWSSLLEIAAGIQLAVTQDPAGYQASLELFEGAHYGLLHALHSATLCELVARAMGEAEPDRKRLLGAALTRDVGFVGLQEILDQNHGGLDPVQRSLVQWHPLVSRHLLEAAGISDPPWLSAVEQHHERLDGSGYPERMLAPAIHPWARILAIADIYSAMTKARGHRDAIQGTGALQEIFAKRGAEVDATITARFVSVLGVYPPGSLVRLACGESAVVLRPGSNPRYPQIKSLTSPTGQFLPLNPVRDPSDPQYAIEAILPRDKALLARLNHRQLWGDPEKIQIKSAFPTSTFPGA
jgi:HD-GYP domain-containing protein (c-di-GMP phosphodiesterase class II)